VTVPDYECQSRIAMYRYKYCPTYRYYIDISPYRRIPCCKQCKQVKFKGTMPNGLYKNKHTEQHEHAEQHNLSIVGLKTKYIKTYEIEKYT